MRFFTNIEAVILVEPKYIMGNSNRGSNKRDCLKCLIKNESEPQKEVKYTKYIEQLESELINSDDSELQDGIKLYLDSKSNELNTFFGK